MRQKIKLILEVISLWILCICIFLFGSYGFGFSVELLLSVVITGNLVTLILIVSESIFESE
ncbi:hypothetical protein LCGC14_0900450 [marine sediment metagenome]|uniref:Uncharacterized protein n=1 Tax=marine sediment metagenome TaxID=412755 RepID=A0A0F9S3H0_9ZZZZ